MKIKPFNTLVLVEKIVEEKQKGGLYLPDAKTDYFCKFKVLGVGELVKTPIKEGMIVHAHDIMEPIETNSTIGYLSESHIFGEVINE